MKWIIATLSLGAFVAGCEDAYAYTSKTTGVYGALELVSKVNVATSAGITLSTFDNDAPRALN